MSDMKCRGDLHFSGCARSRLQLLEEADVGQQKRIADLRRMLDTADKKIRAMEKALKAVEWQPGLDACGEYGSSFCPECGFPMEEGHDQGCKLAAALALPR